MSQYFNFALIVCILIFGSCGNSSRNKYFVDKSFEEFPSDAEAKYSDTKVDADADTELVTCPICNGLGYSSSSDDLMAPTYQCWACNGSGVCDVESAQQAIQSKAQLDALINGQDIMSGSMPSGDYDVSTSSSSSGEYQCSNCNGSGRCSYCAGRGWTKPLEEVHDCWMCNGTGKCQSCYGKGSHYR